MTGISVRGSRYNGTSSTRGLSPITTPAACVEACLFNPSKDTPIFNNLSTSQNRLKTNFYFAEAEGGMYLIQDNSNIMQYLQTGNLPSRLYTSRYNDNSALKKITLEG